MPQVRLKTLRDVQLRFESGLLVELWCVLPPERHDEAVKEMAAMAHCLVKGDGLDETFPLVLRFTEAGVTEGLTVCWHERDPRSSESVEETEWSVDRQGSMLTLTNVSLGVEDAR